MVTSDFKIQLIGAACILLASSGSAQDFQLFDHQHGTSENTEGGEAVEEVFGAGPARPPAHRQSSPSYREALYLPLIREAEVRHRLPPKLLQALIWAESRFNPMAVSSAGAAGLTQLMPGTAHELGVTDRHNPSQNIDGGARYLRHMLDRFGSVHLALAAYNAGAAAVTKAGGIPKNRETPGYVRTVLDRWMIYGSI